jgi:hypothetical protein
VNTLKKRKTNLACQEIKNLLEQLGFDVRDGKRGGHKVFTHCGLPLFTSSSFNCGHGRNPEVKPAYIVKINRLLTQYEADLIVFLEKNND